MLTTGNAAKLYCLRRIDALAAERERLTILDLGAGTASNFVELLRARRHVRYVAVEPDVAACRAAERNLAGLDAEVVLAPAYGVDLGPADVVASFSVLEHVYDRPAYLASIARSLAPGGLAYVNYDSGHFTHPTARDRIKTLAGPLLARAGSERWHQRFVREQEFHALAEAAGLAVVEAKSFNTELKWLYRLVPESSRAEFMERWLDFELRVNELVPAYEDEHAPFFMTRNFVLRRG